MVEDLSKIDEDFIKNYDEDSNVGYFIKADIQYSKELHNQHSDLPFLPERMKVNKYKKLVCNFYDKKDYVDHIRSLKQALNHGLKIKKIHRVMIFNQTAWLKKYININTELRKNTENDFERDHYKLMNNAAYGKTMENVRKHKIIKLVNNGAKRNKLASEPNYHTAKWFSESLLAIERKKASVKMNKPLYLGLAILSLSKIKMYEYWYDEMKLNYGDRIRLCYYKDIAKDIEKKYDTSHYTVERPLPIGLNKKVIGMMKDELGGKIMKEFIGLRPKCYSYLTDDGKIDKKAKGTKKYVIKRCIMFDNYLECLEEKKKIFKSQKGFRSDAHNVYTQEINKVALSFEDDKRLIA